MEVAGSGVAGDDGAGFGGVKVGSFGADFLHKVVCFFIILGSHGTVQFVAGAEDFVYLALFLAGEGGDGWHEFPQKERL